MYAKYIFNRAMMGVRGYRPAPQKPLARQGALKTSSRRAGYFSNA